MTVGVARQHAGITGQVENCQTVVFLAYVTARAHALFDFRPCLRRQWCADNKRRERARVPHDTVFSTKTQLGAEMVTNAIGADVPFGFVAGDEVYGRSSRPRAACEKGWKGLEGICVRDPGELQGHPSLRAEGGRRFPGPGGARPVLGNPLLRAGLQGPPRLRPGPGGDGLAAALGADPPQHLRSV